MKISKILALVLAAALAFSCLGISAFAADDDASAADAPLDLEKMAADDALLLNIADFFRGTDKGLELDRAPTRAEAATILVRMLCAEAKAASEKNDHPFTDVKTTSAWASDNVGYLYKNGLTRGISDTKFGDRDLVSAKQFYTFCLRALGYTEGEDFTYDEAVGKAAALGVIDPAVAAAIDGKAVFTRGDMATAMRSTLDALPAGAEDKLVDSLASDGSVSEYSAEILNGTNEVFNFLKEAEKDDALNMTADIKAKVDIASGLSKYSTDLSGKMKYDMSSDLSSFKCYVEVETKLEDEDVLVSMYMEDDRLYTKEEGVWETSEEGSAAISGILESLRSAAPLSISVGSMYKDLTLTKADGAVTIAGKMDVSSIMGSAFMQSIAGADMLGAMKIGDIELTCVYDEATKEIKSSRALYSIEFSDGAAVTIITYDLEATFYDYGKTVITLEKELQDLIAGN